MPSDPQATIRPTRPSNLPAAWELTTGSPKVVIAVVDSGIDPTHPDLVGAVLPGYDFVDRDDDATDPRARHGTAVAGAAAARANNGFGGVGACFRCSVMPLRVLGRDGIAFNTNTAAAIDYAVDHGAAVVNASLYGPNSPQPAPRCDRARTRGGRAGRRGGGKRGDRTIPSTRLRFRRRSRSGPRHLRRQRDASYSGYGSWVGFAAPECAPVTVSVEVGRRLRDVDLHAARRRDRCAPPYARAVRDAPTSSRCARSRAPDRCRERVTGSWTRRRRSRALGQAASRGCGRSIVGDAPSSAGRSRRSQASGPARNLAVTYQWERCRGGPCSPIAGATRPRYAPTAADARLRICGSRVCVDGCGAGHVRDDASGRGAARSLARPSIAGGRVGTRLVRTSRTLGGHRPEASRSIWQRCERVCDADRSARRTGASADRGYRLRVEVIASNAVGGDAPLAARRRRVVR